MGEEEKDAGWMSLKEHTGVLNGKIGQEAFTFSIDSLVCTL